VTETAAVVCEIGEHLPNPCSGFRTVRRDENPSRLFDVEPAFVSTFAESTFLARRGHDLAAVAMANGIVLMLFFYFDLSVLQLAFVLWWECVWIGLISWLKLLVVGLVGDPFGNRFVEFTRGSTILITLIGLGFVAVKYFAVLGGIALMMIGISVELTGEDGSTLFAQLIDPGLAVALWLLASHAVAFVIDFLLGGGFRRTSWIAVVGWSYARVGALIVAIIGALIWVAKHPESVYLFAAILVLIKLAADSLLTLVEARLAPGDAQ
jgi:hypothetical protein